MDSFTKDHAPDQFTFVKQENRVQYYNVVFDRDTGIPSVHECITVDETLHVVLSYKGIRIPLPEWFRYGHNCQVTRFGMMENFVPHIRNRTNDINTILQELTETILQTSSPSCVFSKSDTFLHYICAIHLARLTNVCLKTPITLIRFPTRD